MWFYLLLAALIVSLSAPHGPQKTPASRPIDKNQYIENCMTSGYRVGDCYSRLTPVA